MRASLALESRLATGATLAVVSGAALVVSLFLDWWSYPPAFEDPSALPDALRQVAEAVIADPEARQFDAFRFFSYRDALWLGVGVIGFTLGLSALALRRTFMPLTALALLLALAALAFTVDSLISPPDYADIAPGEFSVELPFGREIGLYVALGASVGLVAGSGLVLAAGRRR